MGKWDWIYPKYRTPTTEIVRGNNDLEKVILSFENSSAEIYLYGAQVTSWNVDGEELLFVTDQAIFDPQNPIRGICFPQFSRNGTLDEAHALARNRVWTVDPNPPFPPTHGASVSLLLTPTAQDCNIWPHRFEFRLRITLEAAGFLNFESRIRNVDYFPLKFTFSYYNYFSVSDVRKCHLDMKNGTNGDGMTFEGGIDRIYLTTPNEVTISDENGSDERAVMIVKEGLPDVVVWTPWDMDKYKHMVCVGAGAIAKPITLNPFQQWIASQKLVKCMVLSESQNDKWPSFFQQLRFIDRPIRLHPSVEWTPRWEVVKVSESSLSRLKRDLDEEGLDAEVKIPFFFQGYSLIGNSIVESDKDEAGWDEICKEENDTVAGNVEEEEEEEDDDDDDDDDTGGFWKGLKP